MKIGFASKSQKSSNVQAIYDHAVDLAAGCGEGELEFRNGDGTPSHCNIIISDSMAVRKQSNFLLAADGIHVKYGTWDDEDKFYAHLVATKEQKSGLISQGVPSDNIRVVGVPKLDLLFCTQQESEAIKRIYLRSMELDALSKTVLMTADFSSDFSPNDVKVLSAVSSIVKDMHMNLIVYYKGDSNDLSVYLGDHALFISQETTKDIIPLLLSSDVLLTYSRWMLKSFLALRRPVIIARQKIRAPSKYDEWNPTMVKTTGQMREALEHLEDLWRLSIADVEEIFGPTDGRSCERSVVAVMEMWRHACV